MKYLLTSLLLALATLSYQPVFAQIDDPEVIDENPDNPGGPLTNGGFVQYGSNNTGNAIIMYEGNRCTQDVVITHYVPNATASGSQSYLDMTNGSDLISAIGTVFFGSGPNDEARSMSLQGIVAGRVIELYDDPYGYKNDDWVEIVVKQTIGSADSYQIYGFEDSYEDDYVKVTYHPYNGLDGKVSFIKSFMNN